MRNRIVGGIGVLWGGGILVSTFMKGTPQGQSGYAQGQMLGIVFGALLFFVGLYYLVKSPVKA